MTEIFSDGFESGDFSAWTSTTQTGTTLEIQGGTVHHDDYAMQAVGGSDGSPGTYNNITVSTRLQTKDQFAPADTSYPIPIPASGFKYSYWIHVLAEWNMRRRSMFWESKARRFCI